MISKFIKSLIVAALMANVPFLLFGLLMGWPSVIITAILHSKVKNITVIKSFIINIISCVTGAILTAVYLLFDKPNSSIKFLEFIYLYVTFGFITVLICSIFMPLVLNYKIVRKTDA